jgi:TPR repeat protein
MPKHRTVKRSRRSKKSNGGMFKSPAARSSAMTMANQGVSPALVSKAQTVPGSGMLAVLIEKLSKPPSSIPVPGGMGTLVSKTVSSMGNEAFANAMFEEAAHLRATSFRSLNVEECAQIMRRVVRELKQAIRMGSLRARACLADILLHGNAVGVAANFDKAIDLVSQHDRMDPDCAGVLAQCHFYAEELNDARSLAVFSASERSKYGQLALGLLEKKRGNVVQAVEQFALAADQNYDEAQIALAEMHFKGWKTPANPQALPNPVEALRLLSAAAVQGNKRAFHFISAIQRINKSSRDEAASWFGYYVEAADITSPELKDARNQHPMQYYMGGHIRKHYNKTQSNVGFSRKHAK